MKAWRCAVKAAPVSPGAPAEAQAAKRSGRRTQNRFITPPYVYNDEMVVRRVIAFLILVAAACHSGDSPTAPQSSSQVLGRLSGVVTIGPNCPGPTTTQPCPTPPDAFAARKVEVYDEARTKLLFTVDIDSQGLYVIDLAPAKYTVDVKKVGIDRASGVPAVVDIKANTVTKLDIAIDTGIR
jgi:hypothetical protein